MALIALLASVVLVARGLAAEDLLGQARALEAGQQWSQAASLYEKIIHDDPKNAEAHFGLGSMREKVGMFDAAVREYRETLRLDPDHAGARRALEGYYVATGMTARAAGRGDAAIEAFQQALALDPASVSARLELGPELERRGRGDEALRLYEEGIRRSPDEAALHARLAALYAARGRHADAAREYEAVVRLTPQDATAHRGLGAAYAALGQRDKARAAYDQAIRRYLLAGNENGAAEVERLEADLQQRPATGP